MSRLDDRAAERLESLDLQCDVVIRKPDEVRAVLLRVGDIGDEAEIDEQPDAALAETLYVHGTAAGEMLDPARQLEGALGIGTLMRRIAFVADERRLAGARTDRGELPCW